MRYKQRNKRLWSRSPARMMKSKNILKQEQEFFKLNEEIDLTTKDLMSQVDQIKLNSEKLYDGLSESLAEEREAENRTGLATPRKSSEDDFALKEYLSTRKEDSEDGNRKEKHMEMRKDKAKRPSSKGCHSAKVTPSVVSAKEESVLSLGVVRHKSDVRPREESLGDDVVPETLKGVGHDGITRFLSAKVKLLTQQLEIIQRDERKHLEKIKELQAYKDKSAEEREKLIHQLNVSRSTLVKFEQHANNLTTQLQTAHTENGHLKKELDTLKKEIRQKSKTQNAGEIKLNRTLEETEKLKAALQQARQEEKECRETQRKRIENLTNALKKLDRQRSELLNGFKKQLLIIDNLKRQKDLIEAGKLLKAAEDDFINYLDCNPSNPLRTAGDLKSGKC